MAITRIRTVAGLAAKSSLASIAACLSLCLSGLALLGLAEAASGQGPQQASQQWTQLQAADAQQGALYVDSASVTTRPDGWRQFWLKSLPAPPQKKGKKRASAPQMGEIRLRHALDCQTREIIPPLEILQYRPGSRSPQRITQDASKLMMTRRDVLAMPSGDKVFQAVCGAGSSASPPAAAPNADAVAP